MLEIVESWGAAASKGGPWFLVAVLGSILYFGGKLLYDKNEKLADKITALQEAATDREKVVAADKTEALRQQAVVHEERYEALREEGRQAQERRNEEIRTIAITMTTALTQGSTHAAIQTKALDELRGQVAALSREVSDLRKES